MDHVQIIKDIKNKVYHPVYFLTGDETYYIDLISDYIEKNVLDETEKDFNQTILYGKESDITSIVSEAKRYPMMANNNVVIIKEAQHLGAQLDKLESYLDNPTPSTLLVFCYKYKKVDGRKAIGKLLKKKTVYFESKKLYDNQVPDWITGYLKKKRYSITPPAAMLIADSLGNDLSKVVNELEKLTINVLEGNEITPETVEKNIGISKDFNNFELNKALGSKDVLKANKIVFHFSKNERDHPLVVTIGLMYSFFSNILKIHYTKDKSKNNLASILRVSPFFVGEYETAARNYPIRKSVMIIEYLREYDLKSKGVNNASASNSELLKELIFKILH